MKWLGRLAGDDVPSLPLDFNAVWLSPGRTFLSHSLAGGDVAWEAVVTDPDLRDLGFRWGKFVGGACGLQHLWSLLSSYGVLTVFHIVGV